MAMPHIRKRIALTMLVAGALIGVAVLAVLLLSTPGSDVGNKQILPDGSTLSLRQVVLTATNYNFSYQSDGRLLRLIRPILPGSIRNRFSFASGSFGFGLDGNTNLLIMTVNRPGPKTGGTSLVRLRVSDEQGNDYEACWGAHTLGMSAETVHGWQVRAFPRRSLTLQLRFLPVSGSWTNTPVFRIPNPLYAEYPQWTPEPWPSTKRDGNLAVTLKEFQCGARMAGRRGGGDASTAARKTRLVCSFLENEKPSEDWLIQKITLSDATGNRWFPYLSFTRQDFNWVTNGTVEFHGALWPGENAWKLQLELVRTKGFPIDALWQVPLELPAPGTVTTLTNAWTHDGLTVNLAALASPNTDHRGDFKWVAKWWDENQGQVYSLALQIDPELKGHRLRIVGAVDQENREVKIVEHGSQDSRKQAVFFQPGTDAATVRFTLALQRSRLVEFLARPEFVAPAFQQAGPEAFQPPADR